MNTVEAERVIKKRVAPFWHGRALEMFFHMTNGITTISGLRVSSSWPLSGSITFTRDADGHKVRMWRTAKGFRAVSKANGG